MRRSERRSEKHPMRLVILISQIGITMMVSIFICAWLGMFVRSKTGMDSVFLLFLILGILSGFRSCYRIICRFVSLENPSGVSKEPMMTEDEESEDEME